MLELSFSSTLDWGSNIDTIAKAQSVKLTPRKLKHDLLYEVSFS